MACTSRVWRVQATLERANADNSDRGRLHELAQADSSADPAGRHRCRPGSAPRQP